MGDLGWWFGILGVPISNTPFPKGIPGIQTTNPNHQLTILWNTASTQKPLGKPLGSNEMAVYTQVAHVHLAVLTKMKPDVRYSAFERWSFSAEYLGDHMMLLYLFDMNGPSLW